MLLRSQRFLSNYIIDYGSEKPKVPLKLSDWVNDIQKPPYISEEPKVPQKLSHWINVIEELPMPLSGWVSNMNKCHDKGNIQKFLYVSEELKVPQKLSHWINVFEELPISSHSFTTIQLSKLYTKILLYFWWAEGSSEIISLNEYHQRAAHAFVWLSEQDEWMPWQRHGS